MAGSSGMLPAMNQTPKLPKFGLWGACSRCGVRTPYGELRREALTGLLMCTVPRGKRAACWDPWPPVYDFNVTPDRSIEPPPEPLPARWLLDDIFSAGTYNSVSAGTPAAYANAPKAAPPDAVRLQAFLKTQFMDKGTMDFTSYRTSLNQNQDRASVVTINSLNYDGTFVPSASVRTVTPPDEAAERAATGAEPGTGTQIIDPPWAAAKGI